jgi:hypothetical protein
MSYLSVILLSQAKNHLRIDEDFISDDNSIERMIASALELIEKNTNHLVYQREKTYYRSVDSARISVFDYPINNYDTEVTALHYSLKHEFNTDKITLDVGYINPYDVPSPLIDAALMMIENWYYGAENQGNKADIPERANSIMFTYKRCIVS